MSKTNVDKLSHEKIQQLLAAVGMKSQEDASHDSDVTDYDWRRPRYFRLEQLSKIKAFAGTAAGELLEEFTRLYRSQWNVSVVSAEQRFSYEFDEENQGGDYYIAFGADAQKPFGLVTIPKQSALLWTGLILGDTAVDKEAADRSLSKLEESLLLDIVSGLVKAYSRAYGSPLYPAAIIASDRSLNELHGSDELFEMVFEAKSDSPEITAQISFLMCCDKLESVTGGAAQHEKPSESQIKKAILEHIHRIPVSVRVDLAGIMLPFKDVINLGSDDIVVLDKKVTETVDVLVENRTLFRGRPARSSGNYAVVIE